MARIANKHNFNATNTKKFVQNHKQTQKAYKKSLENKKQKKNKCL